MIVLYFFIIWWLIGIISLYFTTKIEYISNALLYKNLKIENLSRFDYQMVLLFGCMGFVAVFILLMVYLTNKDDIKNYFEWRTSKIPKPTIKELRLKKLKRIKRKKFFI